MRSIGSNPIQYFLQVGHDEINMNSIIGKHVKIEFKNQINCINCDSKTNKSFHQGYCYSCFSSLAQCDAGVLNPEKDYSHLGISRDMEWSKHNSLIDHFVYLALTSELKVGVTRHTQIPTRWIDQGAIKAIKLAKTPYRNLAGQIEVELKKHVSDKTNWSKMLVAKESSINLLERKNYFGSLLPADLQQFISLDNSITTLNYPFNYAIDKFKSVSLDNQMIINGTIAGLKGQYLIFKDGQVINIRKHNGYLIEFEIFE